MGDEKTGSVRLSFKPQLRIDVLETTVTSDVGFLLACELDEHWVLSALRTCLGA